MAKLKIAAFTFLGILVISVFAALLLGPLDTAKLAQRMSIDRVRSLSSSLVLPMAVFIAIFLLALLHRPTFTLLSKTVNALEEKLTPLAGFISCTLLVAAGGVVLIHLKLKQYYSLQTTCYDHGIFANVAWNVFSGNGFYSSIKDMNFLGDHFSPILFLVGLAYTLWPSAAALLVIQSLGIAAGGAALYLLGCRITGSRLIAILFVLFYFLNPYLNLVSRFDFHENALAIPLLLWLLWALECRKWTLFTVLALVCLAVKETLPLALAGIGLFMCFHQELRRTGLVVAVVCLCLFVIEVTLVIPGLARQSTYGYYHRYSTLGGSFTEIVRTILLHPFSFIQANMLDSAKFTSLLLLFLSFAFLPLFGGTALVPALFPLLWNYVSTSKFQWSFSQHYSAELIPFLMYASLYGIKNVHKGLADLLGQDRPKVLLCLTLLCLALFGLFFVYRYIPYVKPAGDIAHRVEFFSVARGFAPQDSICAQSPLVPHLALRKKVYEFSVPLNACSTADYLVLDLQAGYLPFETKETYFQGILGVLKNNDFGVIRFERDVAVLKKGYEKGRNDEVAARVEKLRETL